MTIHIKLVEECRYPTYEKKKKKDRIVSDFATLWTIALQAPLSMKLSMQEYRSG